MILSLRKNLKFNIKTMQKSGSINTFSYKEVSSREKKNKKLKTIRNLLIAILVLVSFLSLTKIFEYVAPIYIYSSNSEKINGFISDVESSYVSVRNDINEITYLIPDVKNIIGNFSLTSSELRSFLAYLPFLIKLGPNLEYLFNYYIPYSNSYYNTSLTFYSDTASCLSSYNICPNQFLYL